MFVGALATMDWGDMKMLQELMKKYPDYSGMLQGGVIPEDVIDAELQVARAEKEKLEERNMSMELKDIFKTQDNLVGFDSDILVAAVDIGEMLLIENYDKLATRGSRRNDDTARNKYYEMTDLENAVFMHVQDGYGVIIPKYVNYGDEKINVVERLARYYWAITTDNEKVKASSLRGR